MINPIDSMKIWLESSRLIVFAMHNGIIIALIFEGINLISTGITGTIVDLKIFVGEYFIVHIFLTKKYVTFSRWQYFETYY